MPFVKHGHSSVRALARIAIIGAMLSAPLRSFAQDYIDSEEPPPTSVDDTITPMQQFLRTLPQRPGLFPWLKEQLKDTPPFFRDTELNVNLRSFYFDRHKFADAEGEAWAIGGAVSYRSGWLADRIAAGSTLYWSVPVDAPDDKM